MPTLSPDDIARFADDGILALGAAIPADQVALMRELIWQRLDEIGVRQDDRATWKTVNNRPLRRIKRHPLFAAIDAPRLHGAIDEPRGSGALEHP